MAFIRVEYDGVKYDLDVLEDTPIRVDISAIENNDIGEVFGAASQQFTLPGSKKNNRFFKHAYKVGVSGVPGLGESVPAWVISESDTLLEGSLFLDEVVRTPNDGINYNVTIVNNVVTFNESVKTVAVKDLNWSSYDHAFTVANITGSWTNNLFSGDVYYPIIDMGRDGLEPTGSVPNVAITLDTGSVTQGYINNSSTPLQVQQFTPAIRVSTVLDKIFEQGEFEWSSSLAPLFDNLYILPKQTEDLSVKGAGFGDYGFIAGGPSGQAILPNTQVTGSFPSEIYDPTNSYNPSTYVYTVPKAGSYVISASMDFIFGDGSPDYVDGGIYFNIRRNNEIIGYSLELYQDTYSGTQTINSSTNTTVGSYVYLNLGDKIWMEVNYSANNPNDPTLSVLNTSRFQTLITPINYEAGTIQLGQQFEPQTKCIDILRGLIQKLNLVIEPVYTENRVLKIESFNTWANSGKRVDWTEKIQKADRISLTSTLGNQQKTLIFEDNKDNDTLSKQVIDNAEGFQWGTEVVDAPSDVPQGERKVGSYFSPVILEGMDGSPGSLIPQLYKTDNSQIGKKTFKFKPRLGYKVNGSLNDTGYIGNGGATFQNYATISNYDSLPVVSGSTNNLHFNESFYPPAFNANATGSITSYDTYWNSYINDLYNQDSKILSAEIQFKPDEIRNIALNDKIFVEDKWYRINKIKGYNLNYNDVVGLELITINDAGYPDINCDFDLEIEPLEPIVATGGVISTFTSGGIDYKSHTFQYSTGPREFTFQVTEGATDSAQILLVGGGGGRGGTQVDNSVSPQLQWVGAGGGAGQVIYSGSMPLQTGNYDIYLGYGGDQGTGGDYNLGTVATIGANGVATTISGSTFSLTAEGGGGGGAVDQNGLSGGSGGGAGGARNLNPNPGSAIYGPYGGSGGQESTCTSNIKAGGAGGSGGGSATNRVPGNGFTTAIRGTTEYCAFGGIVRTSICSATKPTGYDSSLGGDGLGIYTTNIGNTEGFLIITYPIPGPF